MAVTLPDVQSVNTSYTNIYAATGIPVGTAIIIQNKASNAMNIQIKTTQPSATSTDGNVMQPYDFLVVDGDPSAVVWVKGTGKITVQVVE